MCFSLWLTSSKGTRLYLHLFFNCHWINSRRLTTGALILTRLYPWLTDDRCSVVGGALDMATLVMVLFGWDAYTWKGYGWWLQLDMLLTAIVELGLNYCFTWLTAIGCYWCDTETSLKDPLELTTTCSLCCLLLAASDVRYWLLPMLGCTGIHWTMKLNSEDSCCYRSYWYLKLLAETTTCVCLSSLSHFTSFLLSTLHWRWLKLLQLVLTSLRLG